MKLIHTEYNTDGTVKAVEHLEVSDERGHDILKDEVWLKKTFVGDSLDKINWDLGKKK